MLVCCLFIVYFDGATQPASTRILANKKHVMLARMRMPGVAVAPHMVTTASRRGGRCFLYHRCESSHTRLDPKTSVVQDRECASEGHAFGWPVLWASVLRRNAAHLRPKPNDTERVPGTLTPSQFLLSESCPSP